MKQTAVKTACEMVEKHGSRPDAPSRITVRLFENKIPDFAHAEIALLRKYPPWSQAASNGSLKPRLSTYAVLQNATPRTVFVFQHEKKKITVLNAPLEIDGSELSRFVNHIFSRYPAVETICFRSQETYIERVAIAGRKAAGLAKASVILPRCMPEYMDNATRFTRHNINYFLNRVKRDYPSFHYRTYENGDITVQQCRDLINLNRIRMVGEGKPSLNVDDEADKLMTLLQCGGLLGLATIDGRLCAGAICCRVGSRYHLRMLSHDPQYNAYGLAMLCCYLTICESMGPGADKMRTSRREHRYRYRLVRLHREFDALVIRRPHASWLVRADLMVYCTIAENVQRLRLSAQACIRLFGMLARLPGSLVQAAKKWRSERTGSPVKC